MKRVLLVMRRRVLAEAIMRQKERELSFTAEYRAKDAPLAASATAADVALVELPEQNGAAMCGEICVALRRERPAMRILLLCPETDADACRATIEAVRTRLADDFVFYDTSIRYLLSKLEML